MVSRPRWPLRAFRSLLALRVLNVTAVATSLAALTTALFALLFDGRSPDWTVTFFTGAPTLVVGLLWAVLLRARKRVGRSRVRWGWVASVPLAMLNGALAGGLSLTLDYAVDLGRFAVGAVAGASIGAVFWVPGLLATLVLFGMPIAAAQRLAEKGLAGEERGERIVGATAAVLGAVALALVLTQPGVTAPLFETQRALGAIGRQLTGLSALSAIATGALAAVLATVRERRRRRFVADVEAGRVRGFRVDPTPEGKVLVALTSAGEVYRAAELAEEVVALDVDGAAKHALS